MKKGNQLAKQSRRWQEAYTRKRKIRAKKRRLKRELTLLRKKAGRRKLDSKAYQTAYYTMKPQVIIEGKSRFKIYVLLTVLLIGVILILWLK